MSEKVDQQIYDENNRQFYSFYGYDRYLMALLRLHHVAVSTVKSVAEYRASLRVVPEVGYDPDDNDDDDENDDGGDHGGVLPEPDGDGRGEDGWLVFLVGGLILFIFVLRVIL